MKRKGNPFKRADRGEGAFAGKGRFPQWSHSRWPFLACGSNLVAYHYASSLADPVLATKDHERQCQRPRLLCAQMLARKGWHLCTRGIGSQVVRGSHKEASSKTCTMLVLISAITTFFLTLTAPIAISVEFLLNCPKLKLCFVYSAAYLIPSPFKCLKDPQI